MTNNIVTVNVSTVVAPTPNNLQKMGAIISQGATTLSEGNYQLLTQASDLTSILNAPAAITSITWTTNVATVTTTSPHGIASGAVFSVTIAGATPTAYNGVFEATVTGTSAFTYPLIPDPGGSASTGTWSNTSELSAMVNTFFDQGAGQAVYVLELGPVTATTAVGNLGTFITANPNFFYSYLVPNEWDGNSAFLTFVAGFEANTSKTYFFVSTTTGTYTDYTNTMKCVFAEIPYSGAPSTEFTTAASFYDSLNYSPSSTNKVTPFAFTYQYGVTPYPTKGNNSLFASLKAAFTNWVGTGAEGGISNSILLWGTLKDGKDFTYWYSVDWVQINVDLNVSNAVINGSNNPSNPLYFNQDGIDRLQVVAAGTMANGVTYGLVLGSVVQTAYDQNTFNQLLDNGAFAGQTVVNAVPFAAYNAANPSDYAIGKYAGFTIVYTPARGFTQIVFNLVVTDFVAA